MRTAGIVLLVVGLLVLVCGVGWLAGYYATSGWYDAGPEVLAELGAANVALGGGGLCAGAVAVIVGVTLVRR